MTQTITAATLVGTPEMEPPVSVSAATQRLAPLAIVAGAVVGFSLVVPPANTDIEIEVYNQDGFAPPTGMLTNLPDSLSREWQDMLSEAGSGSFKVTNDDVDANTLLGFGSLVAMKYRGVYAWTMLVEKRHRVSIDPQEAIAELTQWSGRGHLALWEEAVVYPSGGVGRVPIEDSRVFNWTSPSYDDSAWGNAKEILLMALAHDNWAGGPLPVPAAKDFVDDTAWALWVEPFTWVTADPGQCFFRQTFTVPNDGSYVITIIMDDWGSWYLDGQHQSDQNSNWIQAQQYIVQLSAGVHLVAANVLNFFHADPTGNPGGFAWSVADNNNGIPGTVHGNSTGAAKAFPYADEPPGMTPGRVMRLVYEEAVARGCFTNGLHLPANPPFDTLDSNGAPWPLVADIATRVGNDYLTFFRELCGTYIDMWMDPATLQLNAVNIGTRGADSGVVLTPPTDPTAPTTGNLTRLEYEDTL